jgi:outer membrane lipoprotein-sorting protein
VTLRYALPAIPGEASREVSGKLALEPPDRVRLDVTGTGERLVARGDGGEWLQPSTKQLLRFGAEQVSPAFRWWRALLGDAGLVHERRAGSGRFVLVMKDEEGTADSATVWLDSHGLPSKLEVGAGDGGMTYRLSGWKFVAARGATAFRLSAPAGYETVDLP